MALGLTRVWEQRYIKCGRCPPRSPSRQVHAFCSSSWVQAREGTAHGRGISFSPMGALHSGVLSCLQPTLPPMAGPTPGDRRFSDIWRDLLASRRELCFGGTLERPAFCLGAELFPCPLLHPTHSSSKEHFPNRPLEQESLSQALFPETQPKADVHLSSWSSRQLEAKLCPPSPTVGFPSSPASRRDSMQEFVKRK